MGPTVAGDSESFMTRAAQLVRDHIKSQGDYWFNIDVADLDVIWFTKAGSDWRILFRTSRDDGIFYRVTRDPSVNEIRIDSFRQFHSTKLSDKGF